MVHERAMMAMVGLMRQESKLQCSMFIHKRNDKNRKSDAEWKRLQNQMREWKEWILMELSREGNHIRF